MHIEAIAVTSLDGKIADREGDARTWVSPEDQQIFSKIKSGFSLIVMGRKTYEDLRSVLKLSPTVLRVVLTHVPDVYQQEVVPNELEFISASPSNLIQILEHRGYTSMLIAGGSQVYTEFIQEGVVDRMHITIEPIILGEGLPFIDQMDVKKTLSLVESKQVNDKGTIHNIYEFNP